MKWNVTLPAFAFFYPDHAALPEALLRQELRKIGKTAIGISLGI